jgi:hypothetical protein
MQIVHEVSSENGDVEPNDWKVTSNGQTGNYTLDDLLTTKVPHQQILFAVAAE